MKLPILILSTILTLPAIALAVETASEARLDEVAERGSHVMPFNLEQTTHIFSKTAQGGLQQVIVKDPNNSEQIKLIRQHLCKISSEFKKGDFSNPAKIHGKDMPGLEVLRNSKPEQISISYRELPNGAEINYASDAKTVVLAIQQFFDAQLSDHARHAMPGHDGHLHHNSISALTSPDDKRQVLTVTEAQRIHVLAEMRALLSGTQNILSALAKDDMAAVAEYSRPLGMGMAHKAEDHLKGALPKEFMQLGMSVHQDFDRIAADAETVKDSKHSLKQLSDSMKKCVACHEAYQISTVKN